MRRLHRSQEEWTAGKFELAEGGTLFLDEIVSMPLNMQVKLLRAPQNKAIMRVGVRTEISVNARLIYATNTKLSQQVHEGSFREDLFYRINALTIAISPLRKRAGDISRLAKHFCNKLNHRLGLEVTMDNRYMMFLPNTIGRTMFANSRMW